MSGKKRAMLAIAVLLLVALLACGAWLWRALHAPHAPAEAVEIMIPKGASAARIAHLLRQRDVIASEWLFRLGVRLAGHSGALQSGAYRFEEPLDVFGVIGRLSRGEVLTRTVTLPEGLRTEEALRLLAERTDVPLARWRQALDALLPGGPDAQEGRLLPDTWRWTPPLAPERLLARMIRAQDALLDRLLGDQVGDEQARRRLRIVASIIEKETSKAGERPLVAAVIYNRLKRGMPLQMDPTVIYGIWRTKGSFSGNLRRKDLREDTPWNTYVHRGLPPTPICNPGRAALQAAAHPADVDYLYFVADGGGGHVFAATLAEHRRNVRRWVRIERERNR